MDKPQFDKSLGGSIALPRDVELGKFVAARANEIAALSYSIENPKQKKLVFQKLPVHMRRRVMSHNAKRLPRKLREGHLEQMKKSGKPPVKKRPSRRFRRRPQNLLQEYNRRKQKKAWLETHIWHAKRFHMIEKWGYKIANYSNDRGHRACYRAVKQHCMLQDVSYYSCIELSGPGNILIEKLKRHCRNELSFGAKVYLDGSREGSLTFFNRTGHPIGTLTFMWRPDRPDSRTIWIWLHPAIFKDVLDELKSTFELTKVPLVEESLVNEAYSSDSGCRMNLLTQSLNRFRILGPLAIAVVIDTLRLPKSCDSVNKRTELPEDHMEITTNEPWHETWYQDSKNVSSFDVQRDIFEVVKTLNSPSQLPRHCVLALTVLDPRFFLPPKRTKTFLNSNQYKTLHKIDPMANNSPLWDHAIRHEVKNSHKSTNEINQLRSGNLVPGVENDTEFDENIISKVPVILIQSPGTDELNKSNGFTSAIDIILPAGWALTFWLSFMYRCARPGGLREYYSVIFENLMLNSPEINHPDTPAYTREAQEHQRQLKEKYFRFPPNRRANFTKMAITSPFLCEWSILVKEWTNQENLHLIRDRNVMTGLSTALNSRNNNNTVKRRKLATPGVPSLQDVIAMADKSSLVLVKITIEGRGRPKNFALICQPTEEDTERFISDKTWSGPVQKLKEDTGEAQRKTLRIKHKELLKRAMRHRKRARKEQKPLPPIILAENLKKKHAEMMSNLYLPKCSMVRKSCDRDVMGYVVQGDFSFSESKGVGWGYVILQPLLDLIQKNSNIVLIRNTQTRQYRLARIDIVNYYA